MPGGPKPIERKRRLELAHKIAQDVQHHYDDAVLAIGLYGSLARGSDGPYSDIEMHCVVRGNGIDNRLEWTAGAWKAEVDLCSKDVLLQDASELDVDWPLTHSAFTQVMPVYDPTGLFSCVRDATLSHSDEQFQQVIHDIIVDEIYERIGKVRNARASKHHACLPYLTVELVRMGTCLIGLANRHLYTTTTRAFEESLKQPGRPAGYDSLCQMVVSGNLSDSKQIFIVSDQFWSGVETWADKRAIAIEENLESLLGRETYEKDS